MNKKLEEGFKFGKKEKNQIEQNLNHFAMGIEFEFHMNNGGDATTLGAYNNMSLGDSYIDGDLPETDFQDINADYCVIEFLGTDFGLYIPDNKNTLIKIYSRQMVDSVSEMFASRSFFGIGDYIKKLSTIIEHNYKSLQQDSLFDNDEVISKLEETIAELNRRYTMIGYITYPSVQFLFTRLYEKLRFTDGVLAIIVNNTINKNTLEDSLELVELARELESKNTNFDKYFSDVIENYVEGLVAEDTIAYAKGIIEHPDVQITYYGTNNTEVELPNIVKTNLTAVENEHENQVEVVTDTVNIPTGIRIIKEMFDFIKQHGHTSDSSGMHVSISIDDKDKVDLVKFLILMEMGYIIDDIFPERLYVDNIDTIFAEGIRTKVEDNIMQDNINYKMSDKEILDKVVDVIRHNILFYRKFQSIKFGDYDILNGRIELRFFGGEDYEYKYDEIELHIYRALYVLLVSSNDYKQKEYLKGLYKKVFDNIPPEALVGLRLSRLYDTGKIKTTEEYKKFIDSELRKAGKNGYRLSISDIAKLARYNGDTVAMDIINKTNND